MLVPTPIGNLGDITLRAIEALKRAEVIAAEDTRHSRILLEHYQIEGKLVRLDAHTIAQRAGAVLDRHENVAFITDAGTPGISDPGAELVALALSRGTEVEALPGATAFVPALVLSGLPLARFTFEGFLPRKGRERRERLEAIAAATATSVLYESPHRAAATLSDLARACGNERKASLSRELSKRFETTYRGSLRELAERFSEEEPKGEVVIVVGPAEPADSREEEAGFAQQAIAMSRQGLAGKDLRKALVALGAPRNLAYRLALEQDEDGGEAE